MHAKRDYYRHAFNRYSTNLQKAWVTVNETLNRKKGQRDYPKEFKLTNGNTICDVSPFDLYISSGFANQLSCLIAVFRESQFIV